MHTHYLETQLANSGEGMSSRNPVILVTDHVQISNKLIGYNMNVSSSTTANYSDFVFDAKTTFDIIC